MTTKCDPENVTQGIKRKTRCNFSAEETAMTMNGGQSFSRRLFAGYQAFVAGVCLVCCRRTRCCSVLWRSCTPRRR